MIRHLFIGRPRRVLTALAAVAVLGAGTAAVTDAVASSPPHAPFGSFDTLWQSADGMQIRGWAFDPDTFHTIGVLINVDGRNVRQVGANAPRPDVHAVYSQIGVNHGFDVDLPAAAGSHTVCVTAINAGAGTTNTALGCRTMTVNHDPRGGILSVTQFPGGFTATGWAYDPNQASTPLSVAITVDGARTPFVTANTSVPVPSQHPAATGPHGFTLKALGVEGIRRVCIYAKNVGLGSDATVGCQNVTLDFSPHGAITSLSQVPGGFHITGWATDPDTQLGTVTVKVGSVSALFGSTVANLAAADHNGHSFDATFMLAAGSPPGVRHICITGVNLGTYGHDRQLACQAINLDYNPTASLQTLAQSSPGIHVTGWASDPDTSAAISVAIQADGTTVTTVSANRTGSTHSGHNFDARAPLPNGRHTVCAIGINVRYGSGNSTPSCQTITLNFNPVGHFDGLSRARDGTSVVARGWAFDPDTLNPIPIKVTVDGTAQSPLGKTGLSRPDVAAAYPGTGSTQGFQLTYPASDGEHNVCVTAVNVLGGSGDTSLGCQIINAVHPVVPSAPQAVTALAGYGGATVSWTKPASDGGAPWSSYVVTASPGGAKVTAPANATSATIVGLASKTTYTFSVVAVNVVGSSAAGVSPAVTTQASPPPQTTPAPISTSRYIRNVASATSTDLATMHAEGAADAAANPSGHGYLILLDIGGQDEVDGGVLLSATTHFVSYGDLVKDVNAYVDGYHSAQKASAPITVALGTNNDVDVSTAAGVDWANKVVNPVRSYAAKYPGMTIAGADDIEPGFRGTYAETKAWLSGYLASTSAPFVNNGSADGCSWTQTNYACNNGWSMSGLYWLSAGASPVRIINLPQIYNDTMAAQWKYISLTGVGQNNPRINFGGALTEWTACQQSGGCGSLTGNSAWTQLWNQLQSSTALKVNSLPYSTDLRIDR